MIVLSPLFLEGWEEKFEVSVQYESHYLFLY